GIVFNGSLAGFALAIPAILASILIVVPPSRKLRLALAVLAPLAALVAVGGMASTSVGSSRLGQEASGSVQSRQAILQTTSKAIGDTMPVGSGLGSFLKVYRLY